MVHVRQKRINVLRRTRLGMRLDSGNQKDEVDEKVLEFRGGDGWLEMKRGHLLQELKTR